MVCARVENAESRFNCIFSTILTSQRLNYGAREARQRTTNKRSMRNGTRRTPVEQIKWKIASHLNSADFRCINYVERSGHWHRFAGLICPFCVYSMAPGVCVCVCFIANALFSVTVPTYFACRNRIASVKCRCP